MAIETSRKAGTTSNGGWISPKQSGDARASAADREVFQRLADEHDENDFGRDEEPGRWIVPAPSDPKGSHGRQRDGQVGGHLAVQQPGEGARIRRESADQGQQHGEIEIVDRAHGARHIGDQARPHGQREQQVTAV
jgi:hypothetical protein